jgi:hypothetical protein
MDTLNSNIDRTIFSTQELKKYTNLIISNKTDSTIHSFQKLTLKIPSTKNNYTKNNYVSASVICKNNVNINESIINTPNYPLNHINNKIEKNKIGNIEYPKRNEPSKTWNKKQKNISFSNQKLWEINRVNQILHKKINNRTKTNNTKQNTSIFFIKATSTINRERKNKDIVKENEVS